MNTIDFLALENAIIDNIDERLVGNYDFGVILKTARMVWDGTGIMVTAKDFTMVFDAVNFELLDYTGYDLIMEE